MNWAKLQLFKKCINWFLTNENYFTLSYNGDRVLINTHILLPIAKYSKKAMENCPGHSFKKYAFDIYISYTFSLYVSYYPYSI